MKILLLGKNGQLGFDLCRLLSQQARVQLICYDRTDCDLNCSDDIDDLRNIDFDVLINCTAYTNVEKAEEEIARAFRINANAVGELAKLCDIKQAIFIHFSTDYVFGDHVHHRPLTESDLPSPLNVYAASKLMGESLALRYCKKTYILRTASLYGVKGASGKGGNFVETMLRLGKERDEISVVSDQYMSPTATWSLADLTLRLLQGNIAFGIYNAVNCGQTSWYEFAKCCIEMAGIDCTLKPVSAATFPVVAPRPAYSVLSNYKLESAVGHIPHWQECLKKYFDERSALFEKI